MSNFDNYLKEQLKNPVFAEEYNRLKPEYEIIKQIIRARNELHLSQKELADRIGMKQSNISRLEGGGHNPSLDMLQKVAYGLGKELHIEIR